MPILSGRRTGVQKQQADASVVVSVVAVEWKRVHLQNRTLVPDWPTGKCQVMSPVPSLRALAGPPVRADNLEKKAAACSAEKGSR